MVNFEMLAVSGSGSNCEVVFTTQAHKGLFNIILVDFLSKTAREGPTQQRSYLDALTAITTNPQFDVDGSVEELLQAVSQFIGWLQTEVEVSVYLPSINNSELTIKVTRSLFLQMCGNIAKHNFLRLNRVAQQLRDILLQSQVDIRVDEALLTLNDFYERMQGIFGYHSTTIAEFLNNIRWGVYEYLQPEFRRSYRRIPDDQWRYEFDYPQALKNEFARSCYWDLMNHVRSGPWVPRFETTRWLRLRY